MNARQLPLAALPALFLLALAGCGRGEAVEGPGLAPAPEVTVAEAAFRTLRDWSDFTGRIEAVETVEVRARVSGYIETVHFEEGAKVEAGDLLFRIDPRPFETEVERLEAEVARAEAELGLARSFRDRSERLLAENATSAEEHEQLAADALVAEAQLGAIRAALESAELELSFTRVTAPISGRVSRADRTSGNLVDGSVALTTIVSESPVYVYFDVDEHTYLEMIGDDADQARASVLVGLINEDGYPHAAELDFVDNQVDATSGTIRARAVLDNADGRFRPGLFARLRLVSNREYHAALIDDRAIGTDFGRRFVFVVGDDSVVEYRAVETGRLLEGLRIVTSGLDPADQVIVNGVQRVRPGVTVAATEVALGGGGRLLPAHFLHGTSRSQADDLRLARTNR